LSQVEPADFGIGYLFQVMRDAIVVVDAATGTIVLWNPPAEVIFGYSADDAIGMSLEVLVPETLRAAHRAGLAHFRDTGHGDYIDGAQAVELPALRKDGAEITIEISLSPISAVSSAEHFALAVVRDVTARKRTEISLRESEERYRRLAEHAPDIIYRLELQPPLPRAPSPRRSAPLRPAQLSISQRRSCCRA
jgi:PAS domain S-box-containing protein